MGSIHSQVVGDELHIARTFVSTGNPNGVVTPGIIGEFYWDSTNNLLYVAESLLNTSWVSATEGFNEFIELTDTPGSYGSAGQSVKINDAADGLDFGQALRTQDSPQFANLTLEPVSGDVDFIINNSSSVEQFNIQLQTAGQPAINIDAAINLNINSQDFLFLSGLTVKLQSAGLFDIVAAGDFAININDIFVDTSTGFVGFGSVTPLAQIFVSSPSADTVPISMQEALGSNGSRIETFVGDRNPEGTVTAGPGSHYWMVDGVSSTLFIKQSVGLSNTGWFSTVGTLNQFVQLSDTPADYTGSNNLVVQVNQGASGLVFGQALREIDGPVFNGLALRQISTEDVVFQIQSFPGPSLEFQIEYNDGADEIRISSVAPLKITGDDGLQITSGSLLPIDFIGQVGNTLPIQTLVSQGTDGAKIQTFIGDVTPEGAVAGNPGDHYWLVDGLNSTLFVKTTVTVNTGWLNVGGNVTAAGALTDNFLVRGDGGSAIDVGNIFMSDDGNDLTIPGALDLTPPEPFIVSTLVEGTTLNGVNHITVVNNYAYVVNGVGNSFTIVDITDPSAMFVVGTLVDNVNFVTLTSVHVSGKYAFVTSNITDCLNIIDITNVSAPVLVGRVVDSVVMNSPDQSFVASKFCYVLGNQSDSLAIINISDPEAPFVAGSFTAAGLIDPTAMYVMGKFAYITLLVGKLVILDISDPTNPVLVGTFTDGAGMNFPAAVYVVGRYAYVTADGSDSFSIIDIHDPSNPVLAGRITDPVNLNRPKTLSIDGDYAYVGIIGPPNDLLVLDISDRTAPVILHSPGIGINGDFFVSGKFAYLVNGAQDSITTIDLGGLDTSTANIGNLSAGYISVDNDVHIKGLLTASGLDVGVHGIHSDGGISSSGALDVIPSSPFLLGSVIEGTNLSGPSKIFIVDNFAYVACTSGNSLTILDITEPKAPFILGQLIDGTNLLDVRSVYVSGKYAYLVSFANSSLIVVDISDPNAPFFVSSLANVTNMEGAQDVFLVGKYCYVVGELADALAIIDISDPTAPVLTGSFKSAGQLDGPMNLYAQGKFAYVIRSLSNTLTVIDISDPTAPVFFSSVTSGSDLNNPQYIEVVGRYAYVVSSSGNSLAIIDLNDPATITPTVVGSVSDATFLETPLSVSIAGDYAYVLATGGSLRGIVVIDISDPTSPVITNRLNLQNTITSVTDIFISGKFAYIVNFADDEFLVVDLKGIDASTASIGNIKAGYLSVDTQAIIKGGLFAGSINAGRHGIHSQGDISNNSFFADSISGDIILTSLADDINFIIKSFSKVEKFRVRYNSTSDVMILETDVDLLIDSESVLSLSGDSVLGVSSSTFDISAVDALSISGGSVIEVSLSTFEISAVDSLSINTDNIFVDSSSGFVGIGTITPSLKLDIVSLLNDTVPFFALENTGLNPGRSERFVGDRNPNSNVTGSGSDLYFRRDGAESASYENKALTTDDVWFKRSAKPPLIVEINTPEEFEALASGGIITVSGDLTLIFNILVTTSTEFVNSGGTLHLTGLDQVDVGINFTGTGDWYSGSGNLRISGEIDLISSSTGTLLAVTGGLVDINRATLSGWDSLGSFSGFAFVLRFINMNTNSAGFTLTDCGIISVFNVAHVGPSGMAGPMFTVNTKNPLSIMSFSEIKHNVDSTGSVFDLKSTIDFDIDLIDINHVAALEVPANTPAPIFKQTAFPVITISSVIIQTPGSGTITSESDNGAGGTTITHPLSTFSNGEIVTITGTTNYNGTFQIFNVVPITAFDIIRVFVGDDGAVGSISSERIAFIVPGGHGVTSGQSIKVLGTNFYNDFYTALLVGTTIISVSGTFISTNTGTMERDLSLDETDFRVNAKDCVGIADSIVLASAFVNNNATAVGAITNLDFTDLVFGTVGVALIASPSMAKWRMIDELNGTFELITNIKFDGWITFDFTMESSGAIIGFRFKFVIDRGAGFVDLDDPVEGLVDVGSDAQNITKTIPLKAVKGDLIKPQITRNTGGSGITITHATINARQ